MTREHMEQSGWISQSRPQSESSKQGEKNEQRVSSLQTQVRCVTASVSLSAEHISLAFVSASSLVLYTSY